MKAIQTLGLTKRYGSRLACDQIHLSVTAGEIFGLLGPNGAGKSTLVKMLVGLVRPTGGTARLLGQPFQHVAVRREIGYLPELFRYQAWLTVREVLHFHADLLKKPVTPDIIDQLLAQTGLTGRAGDRVKSLSKGLQQRLGLAVALIGRPRLIFLDEPTSALDPVGRYEVGELLKSLRSAGVTIFLNSHLLSDVEKLSDSVALIDQGQVLFQGSLHDAMAGEVTRYRVHIAPLPPPVWDALTERYPVTKESLGSEWVVTVHMPRRQMPEFLSWLMEQGAAIYEASATHTSLEEWFLHRLKRGNP